MDEKYISVATGKTKKSIINLFVSGILSGMFIAFGGLCSQMITAEGLPKALSAAVFSVGLIMVFWQGAELFTGNCLISYGVLTKKVSAFKMLRNWIAVYLGNLTGSLIIAATVAYTKMDQMFGGKMQEVMLNTYNAKLNQPLDGMFVKAIFCNVLVCLAVWFATYAETRTDKAICAMVPVFIFVYCGFEHSVANMYFLPAAAFTGAVEDVIPWIFIIRQILIVTVGNIAGGVFLALALYVTNKT